MLLRYLDRFYRTDPANGPAATTSYMVCEDYEDPAIFEPESWAVAARYAKLTKGTLYRNTAKKGLCLFLVPRMTK